MKKFRIGGVPEHFNLPWRLAIEEGRIADMGVEMHWSDMAGGTGQMIKGLQAGTLDIAVLLTEGITKAILEGLDCKILNVYVTTPLRWGIHVPFNSEMKRPEDIKGQTFAISREGSGSHLMAYVNSLQRGWNTNELVFNIVGDIYGGLWALENNEAGVFLWEKYTTHPFVEQQKCKCIGEVVTPWPCFVVAVRNEVIEKHEELLSKVFNIVSQTAKKIKEDEKSADNIAWRYSLDPQQAKSWLSETNWNYTSENPIEGYEVVVDYLAKLNLITPEQKEGWKEKLFNKSSVSL
jgi:ABC-type nitrate/sulfonate/bicarbonate transport system substrate-binding protein